MKKILQYSIVSVAFVLYYFNTNAQVYKVDTLAYSGAASNRINIVIMGDGYTSAQMTKFKADALLNANYFLTTPPFDIYRNYFNFFAIEVISTESDIDHPGTAGDEATYVAQPKGPIKSVNNYLGCTFDYGGNYHRLVASSNSTLIKSIATTNFPLYDFISVIANTPYYGGSGGGILFSTMHTSATEIFVHEFGHTFGLLQDEYTYGVSSCASGSSQKINVSQVKNNATVVWKNWITNPAGSLPTDSVKGCGTIGIFEGGNYCATNWYRPKCYCKMRMLGHPFCEICTEQFILRMDTSINNINSFSPSSLSPKVCKNTIQQFSVGIINTTTNTIRTQWWVDGKLVVNNNTNFAFSSTIYTVGTHTVKAIVQDTSLLAKKRLAVYTKQWSVSVKNTNPVTANAVVTNVCAGDTIKLTASGTTTYNWTYPNTKTTTTQNPKIPNASNADSGIYTVVGLSSTCNSSATVKITVKPLPNITIIGNTPLATGDTLYLSCSDGTSFNWTGPNLFSSTLQNPQKSDVVLSDSGYYVVNLTNNGCAKKDSLFIRIYTVPPSFSPLQSYSRTREPNLKNILIYPNPTHDGIWIKSTEEIDISQKNVVEIYNVAGEIIFNLPLNKNLQYINFSDFPKGMYLIKIKDKTFQVLKE